MIKTYSSKTKVLVGYVRILPERSNSRKHWCGIQIGFIESNFYIICNFRISLIYVFFQGSINTVGLKRIVPNIQKNKIQFYFEIFLYQSFLLFALWEWRDLNPHAYHQATDFESAVSTTSTTFPRFEVNLIKFRFSRKEKTKKRHFCLFCRCHSYRCTYGINERNANVQFLNLKM